MLTVLKLQNFRSHQNLKLDFGDGVNLIVGANGSGKSSIVEAINLVATGSSFRADKLEEMVAFGQELSRVEGKIESDTLTVIITRGEVQGKKTQKRYFEINGARRTARAIKGLFYSVVFRPEDLRLIEGSPSRRRSFLDELLSQLSLDYQHSLRTYEQTLVRRNKILWAVREGEQSATALQYWNLSLIKHGQILHQARLDFVQYCQSVNFPVLFKIEYLPSVIDAERLEQYYPRELAAGHTLIGPHKDDFVISCDVQDIERADLTEFKDLAKYGSRGQQRLAVLWLKTCQLKYVEAKVDQRPMLILDDILSELDTDAREFALSLMRAGQSLITTASQGIAERIIRTFDQVKQIDLSAKLK